MPANESTALAVVYKVLGVFAPGAAGAALSMFAIHRGAGESALRHVMRLSYAFIAGIAIAHFVGGAIIGVIDVSPVARDGIMFVCGLYGLGLAENIREQLPTIVTESVEFFKRKA